MSYLSVDLDFWKDDNTQHGSKRFFAKLLKLNVPMVVVKHHQFLAADANTHKPNDNILINVDYHSDISSEYYPYRKVLSCGNWVDFIKWREKGEYVWVYPSYRVCYKMRDGICDGSLDRLPFEGVEEDNFNLWKILRRREGVKHIDLSKVERIGIAISPDYYDILPIYDIMCMLVDEQPPTYKQCRGDLDREIARFAGGSSKFHRIAQIDTSHYKKLKSYFLKGE